MMRQNNNHNHNAMYLQRKGKQSDDTQAENGAVIYV
jgi:hypothetical protein